MLKTLNLQVVRRYDVIHPHYVQRIFGNGRTLFKTHERVWRKSCDDMVKGGMSNPQTQHTDLKMIEISRELCANMYIYTHKMQ